MPNVWYVTNSLPFSQLHWFRYVHPVVDIRPCPIVGLHLENVCGGGGHEMPKCPWANHIYVCTTMYMYLVLAHILHGKFSAGGAGLWLRGGKYPPCPSQMNPPPIYSSYMYMYGAVHVYGHTTHITAGGGGLLLLLLVGSHSCVFALCQRRLC